MINFLKKYYAFGIGFLVLIPIILLLQHIDAIRIPDNAPWEVFVVFTFWWVVISLPIYKIAYLKKNRSTVYKVMGLIAFFVTVLIIDSNWGMPDNPMTISLVVVFWFALFYLLIPDFIKKYQRLILIVYGFSMLYFTYVRLFSGDLQVYLADKKGMAMTLLLLPIPMLILLWVYEQWRWLQTLKADKANAELALLKTQINPHFFFNTLNNLYSLTVKHSDQAPAVILKLSDMMRYTIYEGEKEAVSLKDEVDYLNNYIELHKIRYHKSVDIRFTHAIDGTTQIAPLLLIVLLENAFKHGIDSLSDNAYVWMNLVSSDNHLHFTIENNFDPSEISQKIGIGLDNLKKRLSLIYPKSHQLTIEKSKNTYKVELDITW